MCDRIEWKAPWDIDSRLDRRRVIGVWIAALGLILAAAGASRARGAVPDQFNYQGVLRNSAGDALNGDHSMVFRLFGPLLADPAVIVYCRDAGCLSPDPACSADCFDYQIGVTVTDGLFSVPIGDVGYGSLVDGPGPGTYTSLAQAFRDYAGLYLEIEVDGQTLSPRIPIVSSGWSMESDHSDNSDTLDGKDSTAFAQLATANTFTTGGHTINTGAAATKGLIVKGAAGQGANLQEWQNSTGTILVSVNPSGLVTASTFSGNGSGLTGLNASNLSSGALPDGRLSGVYTNAVTLNSPSNSFNGDGSQLANLNANAITSGILPSGRFSGTYLSAVSLTNAANSFSGSGSGLTNLNASSLASGTLPDARLSGTYTNAVTLSNASLDSSLRMDANGPDGTQTIFFYDAGSPTAEFFLWSDFSSRFEMSSGLKIQGDLQFEEATSTVRQIRNSYDIEIRKDTDNNNTNAWLRVFTDAGTEQMRILDGDEASALFDGAVTANGIDYAEAFGVLESDLEAGDVVSLVPGAPDACSRSTRSADPNLLGVVSTRPGYVTGMSFDAEAQADPALAAQRDAARIAGRADEEKRLTIALDAKVRQTRRPIALLGRVPVKVDGAYGPIRAGDRLTSSATPGHAMAMSGPGPSIGIALESWQGAGPGRIMAFIQPGWVGAEAFGDTAKSGATGATSTSATSTSTSRSIGSALENASLVRSGSSVVSDGAEPARAGEAASPAERLAVRDRGLAQQLTATEPLEAGDVVVADPAAPGSVQRAARPSDSSVVGIIVSSPGVTTGATTSSSVSGSSVEVSTVPVALAGIVPCKVDASYGAIHPGDLLSSSGTPGYAMRSPDSAPGTILGKALEPLESGIGVIQIVVMLR